MLFRSGHTVTPAQARRLADDQARWHADAGEWSARLGDGTRLWWSDARSYRVRRHLVAELGLHGLAVWRLGSADPLTGAAATPARLTRSAAG